MEKDRKKRKAASSDGERGTLVVVFVSLLIDLLAFTIVLPLLPSLLNYYQNNDKSSFYSFLSGKIGNFQTGIGAPDHLNCVIFGGLIGSLFSLLQFMASPLMGALSDVYGRKPILLLSIIGEVICYALWAVSTTFSIFVLSRVVGGISKGNVSVSTAIVADVTTDQTRGRGMAMIGVAFSLGFIVGPITGALFSRWGSGQTEYYFVWPAILALSLAVVDFIYLSIAFRETLPPHKRTISLSSGLSNAYKYISPKHLFNFSAIQRLSESDLKKVRRIGLIYFLYLFLYSGLEFTLTFLTHLRFNYTSVQQGKMFLFIGLIMAAVQGGFSRRISPGKEKKIALMGLMLIVPAFICIGFAFNPVTFYLGLALYSFASATVVPCLTTVIASYATVDQRGTMMGIFRSLGYFARALGPIIGSIVFWSLGPCTCYSMGSVMLILPFVMLKRLPTDSKRS